MKIQLATKAERKPRPKPLARIVRDDPTWWFSWQPPTAAEWNKFVQENPKFIDRHAAPAGVEGSRNETETKPNFNGVRQVKIDVKKQVPPGAYNASFEGVEETDHPEYGSGLQWSWKISDGKQRGQLVYRTTKDQATAKNSAGKFLQLLTGLPLDQAASKDLDDYIGAACSVIVELAESGSTRVASFAVLHPDGDDDAPFDVDK